MKTFQAVCAKNNQKVELVVKYNSLEEARSDLHKQGYSIMDIREIELSESGSEKVYYFEINLNGQKKYGQIQSNDIFKAYVKLVEDLHYKVEFIYDTKDASEEEKTLTTSKVQSGYQLYRGNKTASEKKEEKIAEQKTSSAPVEKEEQIYVKKELDRYYGLIDSIISKVENIISVHGNDISPERKTKLNELYTSLRQVKNITNIDKLKLIGESSLIKIGELEIEIIAKNTTVKKQEFLKETNYLLKQFGSSHKVRTGSEDMFVKLKDLISPVVEDIFGKTEGVVVVSKDKIDKNSFVYYKNLRELHIYQEKLKETNKELLLATLLFKWEKISRLKLKKKLVEQNIQLIKNRLQNKKFSYTKIIKWLDYYTEILFYSIRSLGDVLLYGIFLYSFLFIGFQSLSKFIPDITFNFQSIYHITLISFLALLSKFVKSIPLFIGCIFTYILFFLYLQINF